MKTAIYPGTFDPVTNGHLDVLSRACRIFDKVIIAVAANPDKQPLFSIEDRLTLIRENLPQDLNVEVHSFDGLLVNSARDFKATAIIRGLRAISDFEIEFQMTHMNRELNADIETIFFMPNEVYFFTSSSLIKDVARHKGDISKLVPPSVAKALAKRFG